MRKIIIFIILFCFSCEKECTNKFKKGDFVVLKALPHITGVVTRDHHKCQKYFVRVYTECMMETHLFDEQELKRKPQN